MSCVSLCVVHILSSTQGSPSSRFQTQRTSSDTYISSIFMISTNKEMPNSCVTSADGRLYQEPYVLARLNNLRAWTTLSFQVVTNHTNYPTAYFTTDILQAYDNAIPPLMFQAQPNPSVPRDVTRKGSHDLPRHYLPRHPEVLQPHFVKHFTSIDSFLRAVSRLHRPTLPP